MFFIKSIFLAFVLVLTGGCVNPVYLNNTLDGFDRTGTYFDLTSRKNTLEINQSIDKTIKVDSKYFYLFQEGWYGQQVPSSCNAPVVLLSDPAQICVCDKVGCYFKIYEVSLER